MYHLFLAWTLTDSYCDVVGFDSSTPQASCRYKLTLKYCHKKLNIFDY